MVGGCGLDRFDSWFHVDCGIGFDIDGHWVVQPNPECLSRTYGLSGLKYSVQCSELQETLLDASAREHIASFAENNDASFPRNVSFHEALVDQVSQ